MILVLGKAGGHKVPTVDCKGVESPGWFDVSQFCTRCDAWVNLLLWWSCWSSVTHSCGLLNHLNSLCGGMFKFNVKFDADLLLYSVILNAMATQYTCLLNGVYCPHWLVQWCHHCLHMCIPVYSPRLPGYINVVQTVHIILTMAGLFPDRPHISSLEIQSLVQESFHPSYFIF